MSTQVGWESHVVWACLAADDSPILAAFEVSEFILGSVYIEARDPKAVSMVIRGVNGVFPTPRIEFVPPEDRPLLKRPTISKANKWVRINGRGTYRGDLAYVRDS